MIFFIKYQVILQTLSKSPTVGGGGGAPPTRTFDLCRIIN